MVDDLVDITNSLRKLEYDRKERERDSADILRMILDYLQALTGIVERQAEEIKKLNSNIKDLNVRCNRLDKITYAITPIGGHYG